MEMRELFKLSPLGCVGLFLLGGIFSAQFGMASVYATSAGLDIQQISMFTASFYVGALFLQFPIGWLSDRMERRRLIMFVALIGGGACMAAMMLGGNFYLLLASSFLTGGLVNPLYGLLLAHANDYLEHDDMASAAGSLLFINGLGASLGPVVIGWMMSDAAFGPSGFFLFMAILLGLMAFYAAYRATQRAAVPVEETGITPVMTPTATPVAVEFAQEYAIEYDLEEQESAEGNA